LKGADEYSQVLAAAFLTKFAAEVAGQPFADEFEHHVQTAHQAFHFSDQHAPVSDPLRRPTAALAATGQLQYVYDMPDLAGTRYGTLVQARTIGTLKSIDASGLEQFPELSFISAADIPGANNMSVFGEAYYPVFVGIGQTVAFVGQQVGLLLGPSRRAVFNALKHVKVDIEARAGEIRTDVRKVLNAGDDVYKSFTGALAGGGEIKKEHKEGNAAEALEKATHKIAGETYIGSQQHFYMEQQGAYVIPQPDGGLDVWNTFQWDDSITGPLSRVTALPIAKLRCKNRQLGGGFGGKLSHSIGVACAAAVAALKFGVPIKLQNVRNIDMELCGGREDTHIRYEAGFDQTGRITATRAHLTYGFGAELDLAWWGPVMALHGFGMNYHLGDYEITGRGAKLDLHPRTAMRAPGEICTMHGTEELIENIAAALGKEPEEVREVNLMKASDAGNDLLKPATKDAPFTVPDMWARLKPAYEEKSAAAAAFNAGNTHKKRGVALVPGRYKVGLWAKSCLVNIYGDGSVLVHCGGNEMGQGLHVKVIQAVAHGLSQSGVTVDVKNIRIADHDTGVVPNQTFTGGSTGSEGTVAAALDACRQLAAQLQGALAELRKGKKEGEAVAWAELTGKAANSFPVQPFLLSAVGHYSNVPYTDYHTFGVSLAEVELDVLTGEHTILDFHMVYDSGKSLNPQVDIGQAEGAFVMGLGHWFHEEVKYDPANGQLLTPNTWTYKLPLAADTPRRWTVELLENEKFNGVLGSKASGEPPLLFAQAVASALRKAIGAAKGSREFFPIDLPFTPAKTLVALGVLKA
jgi:xanthine dehydrogenase large subunit